MPLRVSFRYTNLQSVMARLNATPKNLRDGTMMSADKVMKDVVFPQTQEEVPEDTGELKRSGKVHPVRYKALSGGIMKTQVVSKITYGGPDVPYAVEQHERLDFSHKKGKAKYVEDPLKRNSKLVRSTLRSSLGLAVKKPR